MLETSVPGRLLGTISDLFSRSKAKRIFHNVVADIVNICTFGVVKSCLMGSKR
jgi:hypothetical protein